VRLRFRLVVIPRRRDQTSSKATSVQAVSWALKEGVRLDTGGISSRDWETYPVLKFSECRRSLSS
jgi:hypothetical protein